MKTRSRSRSNYRSLPKAKSEYVKERNRQSAAMSRKRRLDEFENLQHDKQILLERVKRLEFELEQEKMKNHLQMTFPYPCPLPLEWNSDSESIELDIDFLKE
jgi:hypothetical protein